MGVGTVCLVCVLLVRVTSISGDYLLSAFGTRVDRTLTITKLYERSFSLEDVITAEHMLRHQAVE